MSGHSKWSTIKHKKAALDAKKGKLFSKLVKEITVAARISGGDVNTNIRLKAAVEKAKSSSMPSKNIENAIKKGIGTKEGIAYEEVVYEGYGPYGVAILIKCLTDNKKRTVSDIRAILSKHGGSLGENGSVAWQFDKKGVIYIHGEGVDEEDLLRLSLKVGAEDMGKVAEVYRILTAPNDLSDVVKELKEENMELLSAEVTMHAKNSIKVSRQRGDKIAVLVELLEDLEDVQAVSTNEEEEVEN